MPENEKTAIRETLKAESDLEQRMNTIDLLKDSFLNEPAIGQDTTSEEYSEKITRMQTILHSNIGAAVNAIFEPILHADASNNGAFGFISTIMQRVDSSHPTIAAPLYFFATHTDIDPMAQDSLTDEHKAEIKDIYISMNVFYAQHMPEGKKDDDDDVTTERKLLKAFIVANNTTLTKKALAKDAGAFMDKFTRVMSITDREYQFALTPYRNDTAFITQLGADFMSKLKFRDGKISYEDNEIELIAEVKKAATGRKYETVETLDLQLLRTLYTALILNAQNVSGDNVTVYLPTFCSAMGIDIQKGKPNDIIGKIQQFSNCVGFTRDGSIYSLLQFSKYDNATNTITINSPYMIMLIKRIRERNTTRGKNGVYIKPAYSFLIHADIAKERNKAAIEIVQNIIALLHQRGETKPADGVIRSRKKYATIVAEIPYLSGKIEGKPAKDINKQLERAFTQAYKLLRKKTDAYQYFVDLKIPEIIPTTSTLNESLKITHKGINESYTPQK